MNREFFKASHVSNDESRWNPVLDPLLLPNLILSSSLSSDARVNDYKGLSTPSENGSKSEKYQRTKKRHQRQECIPVRCVPAAH